MICGPSILPPIPNFVPDGDSTTYGNDIPQFAWPAQLNGIGNFQTWRFHNVAQNGWRVGDVDANYARDVGPYAFTITQTPWVFSFMAGINNILAGQLATDIYAVSAAVMARAKAAGATVINIRQWGANGMDSGQRTQLIALNALMAADPSCLFSYDAYSQFPDSDDHTVFETGSAHLNQNGNLLLAQGIYARFYP